MSKFCGNCGTTAEDDAKVCGNCGTPFEEDGAKATIPGLEYMTPEQKEKAKKYAKLAAGLAAAVVVIILVINFISARVGINGIVRDYMKVMEKGEGSIKLIEYMPEFEKEDDDFDEEEYAEKMDELLEVTTDALEDEIGKYKVKYEITKKDDMTKKRLKEIKESVESRYPDYDTGNITEGKEVKVKVTYKGKDDTENGTINLELIKEDGKWKIYK